MRRMRTLAACIGSIALTAGEVAADDVTDVRAAAEDWVAALNAGDAVALAPYYHAEETSFGGGPGDLLTEGTHTEAKMSAMFESGFKPDLQWRHLTVNVFGKAAVLTGYLAGSVTLPDGTVLQNSWRTSVMWIHQGDSWQVVHFHASTLLPK